MELKDALESIVLKWCELITEILKQNVSIVFVNKHPTPLDEIDFWSARYENLENILTQLRTVQMRTVVYVLEKLDSFCISSYKTVFKNLVIALNETRDITLYLNPIVKYFNLNINMFRKYIIVLYFNLSVNELKKWK